MWNRIDDGCRRATALRNRQTVIWVKSLAPRSKSQYLTDVTGSWK